MSQSQLNVEYVLNVQKISETSYKVTTLKKTQVTESVSVFSPVLVQTYQTINGETTLVSTVDLRENTH